MRSYRTIFFLDGYSRYSRPNTINQIRNKNNVTFIHVSRGRRHLVHQIIVINKFTEESGNKSPSVRCRYVCLFSEMSLKFLKVTANKTHLHCQVWLVLVTELGYISEQVRGSLHQSLNLDDLSLNNAQLRRNIFISTRQQ